MDLTIAHRPRYWWVFILQGVILLALGIYMVLSPVNGFATLGFLFGLAIFVTGVFEMIRVVRDHDQGSRALHMVLGVISIILGIVLVINNGASETILRLIVGLWFIFRGLSLMSFSRLTGRSWLLSAGGVIIILFGLAMIFKPIFGAITVDVLTAVAFITTGIFDIALGYRLKK